MASRMSNRGRIQRMAQEAEATRKENAEKPKAKPKSKAKPKAKPKAKAKAKKKARPASPRKAAPTTASGRTKTPGKGRMKIVWAVCIPAGKAQKVYPYREKEQAQAEADRLTEKKGTLHVVRSERQPMTEDE